jgi:hypothetical protein
LQLLGDGSLADAALQTIDGNHDGGSIKHFHQPVQQAFVVVRSWLEVFFQDELGIPDGLDSQRLVAHWSKLHATSPGTQLKPGATCSGNVLAHF